VQNAGRGALHFVDCGFGGEGELRSPSFPRLFDHDTYTVITNISARRILMSQVLAIKVKGPTDKVWYFLSGDGGMNRLRIHASQFMDKGGESAAVRAERVRDEIIANNEGFQAKVVDF
jgi:hypothetical protein